tara:strand:- start:814 stop:1167 length:354 start_codon:yes stop_codon:yes gene_type:complete
MAKSMTVQNIIDGVDESIGAKSDSYMLRLINDALLDISEKKQHYTKEVTTDLKTKQRWYTLSDDMIDILKVEVLDSNNRYVMIPKLADPHRILKADTDSNSTPETFTDSSGADDSLT